jgi:hypothetical protein
MVLEDLAPERLVLKERLLYNARDGSHVTYPHIY